MTLPPLFQGAEHLPFTLAGSAPGGPAALLVHGFPGTPAELRPLAEALHAAGWTARGLLLPGFGPEFAALGRQHAADWIGAVRGALDELLAQHQPVVLIGYSLGGALALHALSQGAAPAGLVLLAPFWNFRVPAWQRLVFAAVRRVRPSFRPLARANFNDPRLRAGLTQMLPGLALDDPAVQAQLRAFELPATLLDALQTVFHGALALAPEAKLPILVVQGQADETAKPADTRVLAGRLGGPLWYVEVPGGHDLVKPDGPGWTRLRDTVLDFAPGLVNSTDG